MTVISLLLLVFALTSGGRAPLVKIHEVLGGPAGFVDLHNVGAGAVDLGGWSLHSCTGRAAPDELAALPAGTVLPPGGHFLVTGTAFAGTGEPGLVVPEIPGDGETLLDQRRARADSVAWAPDSPCREKEAALACPGLPQSRDALSTDTDDNRVDFHCGPPAG